MSEAERLGGAERVGWAERKGGAERVEQEYGWCEEGEYGVV